MIEEAVDWLGNRGLDQWSNPWPDREGRDERVREGIRDHATLMICADGRPVGTVTVYRKDKRSLWGCVEKVEGAAWYVHQFVVRREKDLRGLGEQVLDWISSQAHQFGAQWLRMDVWRTNPALHRYYKARGFAFVKEIPEAYLESIGLPAYPSSALFARRTAAADTPGLLASGFSWNGVAEPE
ncbi:GNAT family N-acetyltransferase [Streptosporangiaceae bacterium NEAU-GS5]|nr:GNAT family N-acetyltransferase [Streptosporangiaceae bacterium NEAU-GS5]